MSISRRGKGIKRIGCARKGKGMFEFSSYSIRLIIIG